MVPVDTPSSGHMCPAGHPVQLAVPADAAMYPEAHKVQAAIEVLPVAATSYPTAQPTGGSVPPKQLRRGKSAVSGAARGRAGAGDSWFGLLTRSRPGSQRRRSWC